MNWKKTREAIKGPFPNFSDPKMYEDTLENENVDELCEKLGEWYRDYHNESMKVCGCVYECVFVWMCVYFRVCAHACVRACADVCMYLCVNFCLIESANE